jgi:hypothetical protein
MFNISDTGRSFGESSFAGEDSNFGRAVEGFTGKNSYKELIRKANSVPIIQLLKQYNIKASPGVKLITCPFKSHKGGRERTPSFECYPHTNTFYCHGCSTGTKPVDFVAKMENISRREAAFKIIKIFESDLDESDFLDIPDEMERLKIMVNFSNEIREFRQNNLDEKAEQFIEYICSVYDELNDKHKFDNEGLASAVDKCLIYIKQYSTCYKL